MKIKFLIQKILIVLNVLLIIIQTIISVNKDKLKPKIVLNMILKKMIVYNVKKDIINKKVNVL